MNHTRNLSIRSMTAYRLNAIYKDILNVALDTRDMGIIPKMVLIDTLVQLDTISTCLFNNTLDTQHKYLETLNTKRRSVERMLDELGII